MRAQFITAEEVQHVREQNRAGLPGRQGKQGRIGRVQHLRPAQSDLQRPERSLPGAIEGQERRGNRTQ